MLIQGPGKFAAAIAARHEIDDIAGRRIQRGPDGSLPRHRDRRWRQARTDVGIVRGVREQVALSQVAVESLANAVDNRWISLQQHPLAQAIDEDCGNEISIRFAPGFFLDNGCHDQRIIRRLVGKTGGAASPFGIQFALHGPLGPRQQFEIAGLFVEQISIREQLPFQSGNVQTQFLDDLCLAQAKQLVLQIRVLIQAGPPLPESPAFNQRQFSLGDLALEQLVQQLTRRNAFLDRVAAGLDGRISPLGPSQQGEQTWLDFDTGLPHLGNCRTQAATRCHMKIER